MSEKLYPDNDLDYVAPLTDVDENTAASEPVISGSITAWLVAADDEDEASGVEIGDAVAVASCLHVGSVPPEDEDTENAIYRFGTWLFHIDKADVPREVLRPIFADPDTPRSQRPKPYLVVEDAEGVKVLLPLRYKVRRAVVA